MSPWQWHAMAVDTSQGRTCSTRPTLVETNDTNSSSKHLETLGWRLDQLWMIYGIPLVTIGLVVRYPMEYGYHDLYGEIWWVKLALLTHRWSELLSQWSQHLPMWACSMPVPMATLERGAHTHTHTYTHTHKLCHSQIMSNQWWW